MSVSAQCNGSVILQIMSLLGVCTNKTCNTKKGVYQRIFTPKTPIVQWTYTGICDNLKA